MNYRVVIPGDPIGKQSVRVSNGHAFLPGKTRNWLAYAVGLMRQEWHGKGPVLEGPVRLTIISIKSRPKRLLRKKDPDERLWCPAHPDADNISKAVCDAITKTGVWRDDKQVCDERILTFYTAKEETANVIVEIEPIDTDEIPYGFRYQVEEKSPFPDTFRLE